jgi:adenylate kinase
VAACGAGDISVAAPEPQRKGLRRPVILIGPPGAGKGTQAGRIAGHYDVPHLSSGDMLREYATHGTELGSRIKAVMDRGEFIPDAVVVAMMEHRTAMPDCADGFILDGFPRTVGQAEALDVLLERRGLSDPVAIQLRVDQSLILRRLTGRRMCKVDGQIYNIHDQPPKTPGRCDRDGGELIQREDDREEVIRERLAVYDKLTQPVIEYYRGRKLLEEVDGVGTPESVTRGLIAVIEREEGRGRQL